MARKVLIPNGESFYHINGRCINREWFSIPLDDVWEIMSDFLFLLHHSFDVQIYSFLIMHNHFHSIMKFPKNNMAESMNYFMRECSRNFGHQAGRINQIWGGPYHKSELASYDYFLAAYKYLYRNPVDAGLTEQVENYEFSTLRGLIGQRKMHIPLEEDTILFESPEETIEWLNTDYSSTQKEAIRKGLKKTKFDITNPDKKIDLSIENVIGNFKK